MRRLASLLRQEDRSRPPRRSDRSGALRAVGVAASSYERARAITFFQGVDGLEEWERVRRDGVAVRLKIEHLLASAALPFVFRRSGSGNEFYGDGSLRLTSPIEPCHSLRRGSHPGHRNPRR